MVVPYLADTKLAVVFDGIVINTDYQLIDGVVETTYDSSWGDVESVAETLNTLDELIAAIGQLLEDAQKALEDLLDSGSITEEEAEELSEKIEEQKTTIEEEEKALETAAKKLKKAQEKEDTQAVEKQKEEIQRSKKAIEQASQGIKNIAQELGVGNSDDNQVTTDSYFDGIININSNSNNSEILFTDFQTSVSFERLNQEAFAKENPLLVTTTDNNKFVVTHSHTPIQVVDSLKQVLASPKASEFILWEHFELKEKKLKYKVAYGSAHEAKIGIKHSEYTLLFKSLLERPQTDFVGSVIIRGSQGLNNLAEEAQNSFLPELTKDHSLTLSVYEYLQLIIDLFGKCRENQVSGIVPKCLWNQEQIKETAYVAGIIDGAWEIGELGWSLVKLKIAWDPLSGAYNSQENKKIRLKTIDLVSNLANLYKQNRLMSTLGSVVSKSFDEYSEKISKLDAEGRYLQGKFVFEVGSFFFGAGEIKTALKTGKITSSTAKAIAQIPENVAKLLNRIPGKLKLIKNNILAYALSVNTYIEIARIGGNDLVVLPQKWVNAPTLVLDDLGELSLKTSANEPLTKAHIGVVKKENAIGLGLVDELANAGSGFLSQFDNTIARLTGKSKFSLTGTGKYKTVKGHHPMAKKAFEGDLAYDYKEAFSVKVSSLEDAWKTANQGIPQNIHGKITGQQNSLYSAWKKANPNKKMSLDEMADIEIQSMVNSGIPEDVATGWVVKSIEDLKLQGVTEIKNIPWNGVN